MEHTINQEKAVNEMNVVVAVKRIVISVAIS